MWEYKTLRNIQASSLDNILNSLGQEDWEVATVTYVPGFEMSDVVTVVMKRKRT